MCWPRRIEGWNQNGTLFWILLPTMSLELIWCPWMKTRAVGAWDSSVCPSRSALHPDSCRSHRYALCPAGLQLDLDDGELQKETEGRDEDKVWEFTLLPPSLWGHLIWQCPLMEGWSAQGSLFFTTLFFILSSSNLSFPTSLWVKGRVVSAPMLLTWVLALSLEVLSYMAKPSG